MTQKSIFIASARESKPLATSIAQGLVKKGYRPLKWWTEFPSGSMIVHRLREIANSVDGAVFICRGIDRARYRSTTVWVPRDNLLLEYGMFLSMLGEKRTLLLTDGRAKLPTDLDGLAHAQLHSDVNRNVETVCSHFDRVYKETGSLRPSLGNEGLPVVVDLDLSQKLTSREVHPEWHMRYFYIGEGAKAWLRVREDPKYQSDEVKADLRQDIVDMLRKTEVRTFVSLGPGDGLLDRDIASVLRGREPLLQYIPVDISEGLLHESGRLLGQLVSVPVGILADFEDRLDFIGRKVRLYAKRPILYGLIGNTFGNLDSSESRFMHNLKAQMRESDRLLMEFAAIKKDPSALAAAPSIASLSNGFKSFLASGITRLLQATGERGFRSIEKDLVVLLKDDESDVEGTQTFDYRISANNRSVAYIRRYDLSSLEAWLERELGLEIIESRRIASTDVVDRGLLLLKLRG